MWHAIIRWNHSPWPSSLLLLVLLLVLSVAWGILSGIVISENWFIGSKVAAILVAFGWTWLLGSTLVSLWFSEAIRYLFYLMDQRQPRGILRIVSISNGMIERLLFTFLAIILLRPPLDNKATALAAILAAYVGLKSISREQKTETQTWVSIHAIWGSGVSMAFAAFAGWLFWEFWP